MKLHESGVMGAPAGRKIQVTLISPGQGSSGYYPPETIREAAHLFTAGTHMYLDHRTDAESYERPEGSLRNLVGVLETDAALAPSGELVATAKIFEKWAGFISEAAPHIGVSINATGDVEDVEGRQTVTALRSVESVDFVTKAGRGGRITALLESAIQETFEPDNNRDEENTLEISEVEHKRLTEAASKLTTVEANLASLEKKLAEAETENEKLQAKLETGQAQARAAQVKAEAGKIVEEAFNGIEAPRGKARLIEHAVNMNEFDADVFRETALAEAAEYQPSSPVKGLGENTLAESDTEQDQILNLLKGL